MKTCVDRPETESRALTPHRDILLASDASPAAFAATRVTAALASYWNVTPRVCTVAPPPPIALEPSGVTIAYMPGIEDALRLEVHRQLEEIGSLGWSHEVAVGAPSVEIVRRAQMYESECIVLGLRPHAFLDRMFRDETALSVMRHASVPVLAVTPMLTRLPRRIAVAIDFSRASIAAARMALTVLADGGSLHLVYVEPSTEPAPSPESEGFATIYTQGVAAAFSRLKRDLSLGTDAEIDTVVLHGGVAPAMLSFARRADVDLIAVGSQRHSIARRAFVGSVTSALARAGSCSLLVIPPRSNGA